MEKESHLLELARYVVLNPVRAKMVRHPRRYPWSSYSATAGEAEVPSFLSVQWILSQFGEDLAQACLAYRQFAKEGRGIPVWDDVKGGILLGSEEFVARMGSLLREGAPDPEISRQQRFADRRTLDSIFDGVENNRPLRDKRIYEAVMLHGHTLTALQKHLGSHPSTLSRIVKRMSETTEEAQDKVCIVSAILSGSLDLGACPQYCGNWAFRFHLRLADPALNRHHGRACRTRATAHVRSVC